MGQERAKNLAEEASQMEAELESGASKIEELEAEKASCHARVEEVSAVDPTLMACPRICYTSACDGME